MLFRSWTVARTQLYMMRMRMRKDLTMAVSTLKPLWGKMLTVCKDAKVVQCHGSNRTRTGREMSEMKWGCRWVGRQKNAMFVTLARSMSEAESIRTRNAWVLESIPDEVGSKSSDSCSLRPFLNGNK